MNLFYRKIIHQVLKKMQNGSLVIVEPNKTYRYGNSKQHQVEIVINDLATYQMLFYEGILGAGTAYIKGLWHTKQLSPLIEMIIDNSNVFKGLDHLFSKVNYFKNTILYRLRKNNILNAKDHIKEHYDLSNEFFKCFLDKHMMYSCAIFDEQHDTLDKASEHKLETVCKKLKLKPTDHLLEIGTGWGGLAIYAAQNFGCQVTTTTISDAQYDYAKDKIKKLNLDNQISLIKEDYRNLKGQFDKIVSIEMIEAVGYQYFKDYFAMINSLLKENGLFLLQAITINNSDYDRAKDEVDFIKKYIFPGGCLPSIDVINHHINLYTELKQLDIEDIGEHYVTTLQYWENNFQNAIQSIQALGFDREFINKWMFYFCYCQAGFRKKHISDIQALWLKAGG